MDLFNTKSILRERRTLWIDYDKGISILLVGYGHSFAILQGHGLNFEAYPLFNYIGVFLYGFRMPLFFIISGLLIGKSLHKKGLSGYISSRANNILHPLIIWGFIEVSIKILTKGSSTENGSYLMDYLNLLIDPRKTGVFWYLNALFCIGVIYSFVKSVFKISASKQILCGFVLYSISAYIHLNDINGGFFTDIFQYYIFFAIGDFISRVILSDKSAGWLTSAWVFFPLLFIFIITQYYFTQINLQPNSTGMTFVERKLPFLFLIEALIGCALSMSISFLLQKYKLFTFLRIVGFHSLFIYCMQIIVMNFIRISASTLLKIDNIPLLFLITWSLGTIIPMLIYNLSMRLNLWWLYTFNKTAKVEDKR
jgi:fucose 4-O-acetylase-like acetyltransferase